MGFTVSVLRSVFLVLVLSIPLANAQSVSGVGGGGIGGGFGYTSTQPIADGARVNELLITVRPGDNERREAILEEVKSRLKLSIPGFWDSQVAASDLESVLRIPGIRKAYFQPRNLAEIDGAVTLVLHVGEAKPSPEGVWRFDIGRLGESPTIYSDEQSYLRLILGGGLGANYDVNPWFNNPGTFTSGNPLVDDPAVGANTDDSISWLEGYVYLGVGGVTELTGSGLYAFGAGTVIAPAATGDDIFSSKTRSTLDEELLYAGLLYKPGNEQTYKISAGRQTFTLNTGFLISQYVSQANAGPRPAVYLSPRTALDFSVLASFSDDSWSAKAFYLDPNEYEPLETNTIVTGVNLGRSLTDRLIVDASIINVAESDSTVSFPDGTRRDRAGVWTAAGHVNVKAHPSEPGFWFESEIARQWHEDYSMEAWAGYGLVGFIARDTTWTPSVSYRYAHFSGDDPATSEYERFDTLYSGGLDYWLQGIQINKLLRQSNRNTHRVQMNVTPHERLHLTLDYYHHVADERNNLGASPALAQLSDTDLGQELQFITRWYVSPKVMVQGIASVAFPGDAIKQAVPESADPWKTIQLQLYWGI